jgi:hypothetical protein
MRAWLTVRALTEYVYVDLVGLAGFRTLQRVVTHTPTRTRATPAATPGDVIEAVTRAGLWYFKSAKCLQRSAVVTRLLRRHGVAAELLIGCHIAPLQAHAWVEVEGQVVSDHLEGLEFFHVLDRW